MDSVWPEDVACVVTSISVMLSKGIIKVQGSDDLSLIEEANSGSVVGSDVGSWDDLLGNVGCKGVSWRGVIDEGQRGGVKDDAERVV